MYVNNNNVTSFNSFGVAHIPKEIKKIIRHENIITNIFRKDMLKGKSLLDYANLFSPNGSEKNEKIILEYFQ